MTDREIIYVLTKLITDLEHDIITKPMVYDNDFFNAKLEEYKCTLQIVYDIVNQITVSSSGAQ